MASNLDFFVAFLLGILPVIGILSVSLRRFDRPHVDHTLFNVPDTFGLLVVMSVSLGLVNADPGSLIGFGASRKQMWQSFLRAIADGFAHGAFLYRFILGVDEPFSAISPASSAGFAPLVLYY